MQPTLRPSNVGRVAEHVIVKAQITRPSELLLADRVPTALCPVIDLDIATSQTVLGLHGDQVSFFSFDGPQAR